jgi:hypothetical protein
MRKESKRKIVSTDIILAFAMEPRGKSGCTISEDEEEEYDVLEKMTY